MGDHGDGDYGDHHVGDVGDIDVGDHGDGDYGEHHVGDVGDHGDDDDICFSFSNIIRSSLFLDRSKFPNLVSNVEISTLPDEDLDHVVMTYTDYT